MSAVTTQLPPDEPVFRLTVKQYHAMIDTGVLTDDDPVELLEGVLVFKLPKKPPHRLAVRKLTKALERILPAGYFVQVQEPITLSESEPEPDVAIIKGTDEDYATRHPGPSDIPMVIEVSDTTLPRDRGLKLRTYAAAEIPTYWIVDLPGRTIEIYSSPSASGSTATYTQRTIANERDSVSVLLDRQTAGEIQVSAVLP